MENHKTALKKIKKEIEIRKRERPFREGIYIIKHPLLLFFRPRLVLKYNRKGTKIKGEIRWFKKAIKLKVIKAKKDQIIFTFKVDILEMDMVINFTNRYGFIGFFDTPIGHVNVSGYYYDFYYGDRHAS